MINADARKRPPPYLRNDLDDHVDECNERYERILETMEAVNDRLARMEDILLEIRNKLPMASAPRMSSTHKLLPR